MTESEKIFEDYLKSLGYKKDKDYWYEYSFENKGIGKKIDYYFSNGEYCFLADVKEFSDKQEQDMKLQEKGSFMKIDLYKSIRGAIKDKRKQFKPYRKLKLPCIIILNQGASFTAGLSTDKILLGALLGNVNYNFRNGSYILTGQQAIFQKDKNKWLSAVVRIKTDWSKNKETIEKDFKKTDDYRSWDHLFQTGRNTQKDDSVLSRRKKEFFRINNIKKIPVATIVINHFAQHRLDRKFFSGHQDTIWRYDSATKKYICDKL